jgi:hypothetical protein
MCCAVNIWFFNNLFWYLKTGKSKNLGLEFYGHFKNQRTCSFSFI